MNTFILASAEKLINIYLKTDPEVATRLQRYDQKTILISLSDVEFDFFIKIENDKIKLVKEVSEKARVKIKGRSFSLLRLLLNKEPVNGVINEFDIEIEGDVLFLQAFNDVFSSIDVDWADFFSPYLGDFFSFQLVSFAKKTKRFVEKNQTLFLKNVTLYLQEETKLFPNKYEIHDWYDDVSCLRDDVERLQARIEKLL